MTDIGGTRILFVTGMHRSGTSAIANQLVSAGGVAPSDLMAGSVDNPAGFFESEAVVRINEQVLEMFGGNWRDPSPLPNDWLARVKSTRLFSDAVAVVCQHKGVSGTMVLKDPRLARVLPLWLCVCEQHAIEPALLVVMREPVAVARSLWVRNDMPSAHSLQLWCRYYIELSQCLDLVNYSVIGFESYMEQPESLYSGLAALDLPGIDPAGCVSTLQSALVHHDGAELHTRLEQDLRADFELRPGGALMEPSLLRFHYAVLGGDLMALERRHYGTVAMILDQVLAERDALEQQDQSASCSDQDDGEDGDEELP